jgi:NAD(P)-dependent dehydrogenase (short-subunit alcohol dehydrogenase family)
MGKIILITGTSSGFGKLTAQTLAKDGHKVYASMRDPLGKNAEKAKELSDLDNIEVLDLDVTDDSSVSEAVNKIIEIEGKIDVVVNNAGIGGSGMTEAYTIEDSQKIFNVNVWGPMRLNRAVLPQMRKQKSGLIIQISSVIGRLTMPFITTYTASKWAVEAIAECYNQELKPYNVESVIIEPGAFPTGFFNSMISPSDSKVISEYGEYVKAPEQMFAGVSKMFEGDDAPNPQMVADAVKQLVDIDAGKRPLRTVVDPITGQTVEGLNKVSEKCQAEMNKAFEM